MNINGIFESAKDATKISRAGGSVMESKMNAHNKPFSSIAYLAKSTATLNVSSTKLSANDTTHVSTDGNDHRSNSDFFSDYSATNGINKISTTSINGATTTSPSFGKDENSNRTWDLQNFVKRVPSALMTPASIVNGGPMSNGSDMSSVVDGSLTNSYTNLSSISRLNSLDCWDYTIELELLKGPQDLQLAAELGKTLLERNKELESALKQHQNTIEDQAQEIVYLQKQTAALREVNDSRLKIYEQLEVGIQDLERANHRLIVENTGDKKHIKTLVHNIETLEARIDELNRTLEETRKLLAIERRKNERLLQEKNGIHCTAVKSDASHATSRRLPATNNESKSEECSGENKTKESESENCYSYTGQLEREAISEISGNEVSNFDLTMVDGSADVDNDEILRLVNDLETTKKAFMSEQRRCGELEEQLVAIIQENQALQNRIAQTHTNEDMKSMHEELSMLEEVRQGTMCSRCLRSCDDRVTVNDEQSSIAPTEEEDDRSLLGIDQLGESNGGGSGGGDGGDGNPSQAAYRSSVSIKVMTRHHPDSLDLNAPSSSPNPYRDLVEKYEALLEVQQRHSMSAARKSSANGMSLAEELQSSGEFNTKSVASRCAKQKSSIVSSGNTSTNEDGASSCNGSTIANKINEESIRSGQRKNSNTTSNRRTPTEFSEAETSSSGFSDETSNKYTQTDDRPGFFLCSIGDGEDCKFSIYDDVSPIDSRFRNRPEYRELFKEIFAVLKKAAENKEEGEKLPLLDDTHPVHQSAAAAAAAATACAASKVPPVTPANEEMPAAIDFGCDDTQSIISSAVSEQSFAMSECVTKLERKTAKKHIIEKNQENKPPMCGGSMADSIATTTAQTLVENGRVLTPLKREPLEYVTVGVGIKKKNRRKNRNFSTDRSDSPAALPSPPKIFLGSGKKRKDMRPFVQQHLSESPGSCHDVNNSTITAPGTPPSGRKFEWNGSSMVIYNRGINTPKGRELDLTGVEYRPSTVSQDLHKLKKLDLSYAEVLRRADACKHTNPGHHHHQYHHHRRK